MSDKEVTKPDPKTLEDLDVYPDPRKDPLDFPMGRARQPRNIVDYVDRLKKIERGE